MTMDEGNRFSEIATAQTNASPVSMSDFSEGDYISYLDGLELEPVQASELLRILWDISRMCIEMDLPPESWGQIASSVFASAARDSRDVE